ncbi:hypothetical protein DES53_111106 [Roseimicrobium gellanilyticum]|uniref:Uncharacterized protein n=1 Tax=Roseimicrobium gellanilyticum TaxID=748857 RepID=A0A366H9T4_9BACT|nr:hypothetical protein [Roseimicrobium gellanilyticum]RBP38587.1 hypothetical protein DES53_111106 [Roseimicrobium gellanilyticum]
MKSKTCRSALLLVSLLTLAFTVRADDSTLFAGTCRNVTHGVDGLLKLFVVQKPDGALEGYMSISGWLVGSGPLKGSRAGNTYKFTTSDPLWGLSITWEGVRRGDKLIGEYVSAANPKTGTDRQVGEWEAELETAETDGAITSEESFRKLFKLRLEADLNSPIKLQDGTTVTGAQGLFQAIHPVGSGVSVCVTDVSIDWKEGATKTSAEGIQRYVVDYTLFWQGVVRPTGHTKLRLKFNAALNAVTAHELVETTGTTNQEVGEIAFGIGVILGKAAMDSLLESK